MAPRRSRFVVYAWCVLAFNLAVIAWGAVVRATGSGAGCGSHWPLCNGEVVPRAPSVETLIELSHRITSGLALLLVVGLVISARRAFAKGHAARRGAVLSLLLIFVEAAIGAGLVLFELVAENESMARAMFMATHLGNTFLLIGALTLTAHWGDGGAEISVAGRRRLAWLSAATLATVVIVGMSGAVAALGDTLFPATDLASALAADLSPTSHILLRLRIYHPLLAVLGSLALLYYASKVRAAPTRGGSPAARWAGWLSLLVFVQLAAGTVNLLLLAPVAMQIVHLLLANAVWIVLVLTAATALATGPQPPSAAPSGVPS